jgi:hypothetical protein
MARLDVAAPISDEHVAQLKSAVLQLPGVRHCFVNADAGTITYGYDRNEQTQDAVLAHVRSATELPVSQFVVSAEDMASGCPIKAPAEASFW